MTQSDDDILRRVHGGDREAYFCLFDRYYGRIESYARRRMHNSEAARDIASETFLRAYRTVDLFRIGEISYVGYLFLICRRLMLTELTRNGAFVSHSLNEEVEAVEAIPSVTELPLDLLLSAERCAMLKAALGRLSRSDQEIIHLAFERDLSRRDIADVLDKPSVSAVTSHLHRAMQKLKAIIVEQGYFDPQRSADPSITNGTH